MSDFSLDFVATSLPIQIPNGSVNEDRDCKESIELFRKWIRTCEEFHVNCKIFREKWPPRRLLDCNRDRGVKLCDTHPEQHGNYMALSYCWGGTMPLVTEKAVLPEREKTIPWDALPRLYQDAILLARSLGIEYLWIDALCIVQDDDEDKDHEISKMGNIFEAAFLVVVVAAARSPYVGFLREQSEAWRSEKRFRYIWRNVPVVRYGKFKLNGVKFRERVHNVRFEKDACVHERIGKRAWTFQERLLARRCLIFRSNEVVWECKTTCECECSGDQSTLPPERRLLSYVLPPGQVYGDRAISTCFSTAESAYAFWKQAVKTFSSRQLSWEKDRLPAISALASVVSAATGDRYLAGLWESDLVSGLTWYHSPLFQETRPYKTYIAPSWSWASTSGATRYNDISFTSRVEIVDAWCKFVGKDIFGPVTDGAIELRGVHCLADVSIYRSADDDRARIGMVLADGTAHESESSHFEFSFLDGYQVHTVPMPTEGGKIRETLQRVLTTPDDDQHPCSGRVRLLWLAEHVCLILAYAQQRPGAFTRLGILGFWQTPPIPDLQPSRVKII